MLGRRKRSAVLLRGYCVLRVDQAATNVNFLSSRLIQANFFLVRSQNCSRGSLAVRPRRISRKDFSQKASKHFDLRLRKHLQYVSIFRCIRLLLRSGSSKSRSFVISCAVEVECSTGFQFDSHFQNCRVSMLIIADSRCQLILESKSRVAKALWSRNNDLYLSPYFESWNFSMCIQKPLFRRRHFTIDVG